MRRLLLVIPLLLLATLAASAASVANAPAFHQVFRSIDRGRTWTRSDAGLDPSARINAFTATSHRHVVATDLGISLSDDAGRNWQAARLPGTAPTRGHSLTRSANMLFAGTAGAGVLTSADEGVTWRSHAPERGPRNVRALLSVPGAVYAGTDSQGVFRSADDGRTWVQMSEGLPESAQIFDLTVVDQAVFAGLYNRGLYRLDVPGNRWNRVGDVVPLVLAVFGETLLVGHNPGGIHWTPDLGRNWQPAAGDLPDNATIWAMAADRTLALAGAADGLFLSEDQGRTWSRPELGLPAICPGIAFLVTDNLILAATTRRQP
jgi:photosystem II stability/assembly factor-like uncharacterized protein